MCDICGAEMICILSWINTNETNMRRKITLKCTKCSDEYELQRIGENK